MLIKSIDANLGAVFYFNFLIEKLFIDVIDMRNRFEYLMGTFKEQVLDPKE